MRRLLLILIVQIWCALPGKGESPSITGKWTIEITFPNAEQRSLRFEAHDAGRGSFLLLDARSQVWEGAKPSEAKWILGAERSVTFSGAVEFPLGNVGRDPGTLVFKGKFETDKVITGEVEFSPSVGDRPTKTGTFKATRA